MEGKTPLAFVLGGGQGTRLEPLTKHRAKPAVPFGGSYRVIDFVLTNLYRSRITKICVLTMYESASLHRHLRFGWYPKFGMGDESFIMTVPARQGGNGHGGGWYKGTADAITQNLRYIQEYNPNIVDIFGGDHVYFMDVSHMNKVHLNKGADLTISAIPVDIELAKGNYGVLVVNDRWELIGFEEKPENPTPMPGNPSKCLASMGNYAFKSQVLLEELVKDRENEDSKHDFGYNIIPSMLENGRRIFVYNFSRKKVPGADDKEIGYWRDIGNLDQFHQANMEIRAVDPTFNLYNPDWSVLTHVESLQPVKLNGAGVFESVLSNGTKVTEASIASSVLSYGVKVEPGSDIVRSVLLGHNEIGRKVMIKNAIVDRGINIPDNETVGVDRERDLERGFTISDEGITVVPYNFKF